MFGKFLAKPNDNSDRIAQAGQSVNLTNFAQAGEDKILGPNNPGFQGLYSFDIPAAPGPMTAAQAGEIKIHAERMKDGAKYAKEVYKSMGDISTSMTEIHGAYNDLRKVHSGNQEKQVASNYQLANHYQGLRMQGMARARQLHNTADFTNAAVNTMNRWAGKAKSLMGA